MLIWLITFLTTKYVKKLNYEYYSDRVVMVFI